VARQLGQRRTQLLRAGRAVFGEVPQHRRARGVQPRVTVVGDSGLHRVRCQPATLVVGHPITGGRLDQRQIPGPHRPERAPHREVFDQRAALVEFGVQIGDGEAGQSRPQRKIRGGGVGGVQPDKISHHTVDRVRWLSQEVPPRQPRPSFLNHE
jgi:hypothetical protein